MIVVSFCCNNPDNGDPTGKVCAVQIHGGSGVDDLEFEGPSFPDATTILRQVPLPDNAPSRCDGGFKIGRYTFPCTGWKSWYGNWCWDGTRMTGIDVLVLIRTLRKLRYRLVAGESKLYDAYESGAEITPTLVQEALK